MSELTTADAQFSIARVLKPFPGFVNVYEGELGSRPIAFPGVLDDNALTTPPLPQTNGFDPNLIAGISVPLGSKVLLWIPTTNRTNNATYRYQIIWRMRNLKDYQTSRKAYHLSRQSKGSNDQFVIPAAVSSIPLPDPTSPNPNPLIVQLAQQFIDVAVLYDGNDAVYAPIGANDAVISPRAGNPDAALQQGTVASAVWNNQSVFFQPYMTTCLGDEMLILASKPSGAAWDFSSGAPPEDFDFGALYGDLGTLNPGSRDAGIYVFTGTAAT
jgi:hypothetical protein